MSVSKKLKNKHTNDKFETIKCPICNRVFKARKCAKRKFCSRLCYYTSIIGTKQTPEHIEKLRKSRMNVKRTIEWKEKISKSLTGYKHPEDFGKAVAARNRKRSVSLKTREKMSFAHRGNKSSFWRGGTTSKYEKLRKNPKYYTWRKQVFERDNYTCQVSGQKGGELEVHHIESFAKFPELRFKVSNGVTMSKKLHREFHKRYGTARRDKKGKFTKGNDITRKQYEEFRHKKRQEYINEKNKEKEDK